MISFDEFSKVELHIGTILSAEEVAGSEKLIKQIVDFGKLGQRQILSGDEGLFRKTKDDGRLERFNQ